MTILSGYIEGWRRGRSASARRNGGGAAWSAPLLLALLLSGCGGETADPGSGLAEDTTPAPANDSGAAPSVDAPTQVTDSSSNGPIPASTPLTAEGWGPLRIGMTRAEVVAAAGEDANPNAVGGPEPESCDEFRPELAPAGLLVMLENGRLTRISVGSSSPVRSDRGIGIGAPAADVRRTYGGSLLSSPHKYVAAPAEYLTTWTVAPPAANARGIVYEVGEDGRVSRIHAGSESIQYVEGCL